MREFTLSDTTPRPSGEGLRISGLKAELVERELPWQKLGLQQTALGYGGKLTTRWMIHFEGRLRRVYVTQFSNAGSAWFTYKGEQISIDAH